ncbi:MAG: PEGA domain-containing protein [Acidobacteriota bacterium]
MIEDHDSPSAVSTAMEDAEISSDASSADSSSPAIADKNISVATSSPPARAGDGGERKTKSGRGWWALAGVFAIILIALTLAAGYLITRRPTTVDQVVILTVPAGADVKLNSRDYGQTPVKIEHLPIGTYTLTITKERYQTEVSQVTISESDTTLEYKLKLELPADSGNLSPEQRMKQFAQRAEEAFAEGHYADPYEENALYYTQLMLDYDPSNEFARNMRERIRLVLLQSAEDARRRRDMREAKDIYYVLVQYYPGDRDVIAARAKFESELSSRRGDARSLARKAEEALSKGRLTEPSRANAYYYANEALALESQNAQALAVLAEVKRRLAEAVDQAATSGDTEATIDQMQRFLAHFDDKQMRERLAEMMARRSDEKERNDPVRRRTEGLNKYGRGDYREAIPDLQFAVSHGKNTPETVFALAYSYRKTGQNDLALSYLSQIHPSAGETYNSALTVIGDIALERGDADGALRRYREARQRGGSLMYPTASLDYKMENIERRQEEKAAQPTALSIRVRHLHSGLLGRSCEGELTVSSTGVVYRSADDNYSASLAVPRARVVKGELIITGFTASPQKFKAAGQDAERFRETLAKFQNAIK